MRIVLLLVLGMGLTGQSLFAESPLPLAKWKTQASPESTLALSEAQGNLLLEAYLAPNLLGLNGHQTFHYAYADLFLQKPMPLTEDIERIIYESTDLRVRPQVSRKISLRPVIRDAEGELFIFEPKPFPHLGAGGLTWSKWMTTSFYAGEAGAAASGIYSVEGEGGNAIPDQPLEFLGFKLTLRIVTKADNPEAEKVDPVDVKWVLGDFATATDTVPFEMPFAYVDAFLEKAGTYTVAVQVRNEFQALPVREQKQTIVYNPDDLASRKQKLTIPLGPDDNYWIDYQITDADGGLVTANSMRQQVLGSSDTTACTPVDAATPPAIGFLRINPTHPTHGVYDRGTPLQTQVRVFPQGQADVALNWKLFAYSYDDVVDQGTNHVSFGGKPFVDLEISPKPQDGRDAYRLQIEVRTGDQVVDLQTYFLGYRTDHSQRHDRAGLIADRREIKKQPYNRTTYLSSDTATSEDEAVAHFREYLTQASPIAQSLTYMIDLRDFEVIPGVFDFAVLDRVMDAAADYGCKITVRLAHADKDLKNLYRWPKYSRQFNYDGTVAPGHHWYGAYAVTDPTMQKLWLDSYRALYDRYNHHTAFEGYYIMQPGGEWTVVDQPWMGAIAGYSKASAIGFRDFMKTTEGHTLETLNRRWGTHFTSWDEVKPPMPTLRDGAMPDLRMQWVDFNRFKSVLASDIWFPKAIRAIREYDDQRVTIIYGAPNKYMHLAGLLDYGHNGGNHYGNNLGDFIKPWEEGQIGWITEPHHPHCWAAYGDPAQKGWVLDWSVWVMTAQAAGGGSNLHIYYNGRNDMSRVGHYGGVFAYDAMESFKPILTELHEMKLYTNPTQVAVYQDRYTLYCKHRTTFNARLDDLNSWFELLQEDSVPYAELNPDDLADYKLVLPNIIDEVISKDTLDQYVQAANGGASMIIAANTGKYVPELGKEPFQLLKALGITPPASDYSGKGKAITATVGKENPLFFNAGETIAFQTTDSFRAQLASEDVRKNFWSYRYRWIPETDYFGYYPGHQVTDGQVIASFADGGAAISVHNVGKGRVVVFWGTPDVGGDHLKGMMKKAADWAGAVNPLKGNPLRYILEGYNDAQKRHYLLVYNEKPGSYTLKVPHIADGEWFLDDPVSNQRLGRADGAALREKGVELTWIEGMSPLKYIRMVHYKPRNPEWAPRYPVIAPKSSTTSN